MSVHQILKFMAYKAGYLPYTYALRAAVATVLVINIYNSDAGQELGLTHGKSAEIVQSNIIVDQNRDVDDPLSIWTKEIAQLSQIARDEMEELYRVLITHIDSKHFKNKLAGHPQLWLPL